MLLQTGLVISSVILISFSLIKCFFEKNEEDSPMSKISELIRLGANSCIRTQYSYITTFILITSSLIFFLVSIEFSQGIVIGSTLSLLCVLFSLHVSMRWNLLTAISSAEGIAAGFNRAFESGKIISIFLFGICILFSYIALSFTAKSTEQIILGIAIGSALVSAFSRISGGIFTKAADVVADLVGKVFYDMPEDDPKNPAVIADNIGDNVGDGSGTMCEIFASYVAAFTCAIFLQKPVSNLLIISLGCSGIASLISIGLTRMSEESAEKDPDAILHTVSKMIYTSVFLSALFALVFRMNEFYKLEKSFSIGKIFASISTDVQFIIPFLLGIFTIPLGMGITIRYSSRNYAPVKNMANSCETGGAAMNLIYGYSYSLESAFLTGTSFGLVLLAISLISGMNGLLISLFATLGMIPSIMSMDAYGPVCDNAGSIATMSNSDAIIRENTDELDSIGNMVKALTKSYICIISIITTFLLIKICISSIPKSIVLSISEPVALAGLLIGISSPFLFSGISIRAVSNASEYIFPTVIETIKNGNYEDKEYYSRPIEMLAIKSLKNSVLPILAIFFPILLSALFISSNLKDKVFSYLTFSLAGNAFSSILLSVSMTIGGGALDNTKKLVESRFPKGHEARKASVIGDTFGDPLKDTAGPALIASLRIFLLFSLVFFRYVGGLI